MQSRKLLKKKKLKKMAKKKRKVMKTRNHSEKWQRKWKMISVWASCNKFRIWISQNHQSCPSIATYTTDLEESETTLMCCWFKSASWWITISQRRSPNRLSIISWLNFISRKTSSILSDSITLSAKREGKFRKESMMKLIGERLRKESISNAKHSPNWLNKWQIYWMIRF